MKRILYAVCAAIFLAAQTAFSHTAALSAQPCAAREISAADSILAYFESKRGGKLFEELSFGESDRAAICYMRLYSAESAKYYLDAVNAAAHELMNSDGFVRPTELQRAAVVLSAGGVCPQDVANAAAFNNADLDRQGLNAWLWALIAANCSALESEDGALNTRQSLADEIISRQLSDGGFALSGSVSDADMTAAAIYALAPLADSELISRSLARAEERLRALQQPSGGFCSMGKENCESAAQAVIALSALGYDESDPALSAALSALGEYARSDGGYAHLSDGTTNALATSQALEAFTAVELAARGERLYDALPAKAAEPADNTSSAADETSLEEIPPAQEISSQNKPMGVTGRHIKLILCVISAAAGGGLIITALIKKSRTAAVAGALFLCAAGGVWLLNIKTPREYYAQSAPEGDIRVTVLAECADTLSHMDLIDESVNTADVIPADGIVLEYCEVWLPEGATAFDALTLAARQQNVRVNGSGTLYGVYVSAIGHIAEFGFGGMSGWLYSVNGEYPEMSCADYMLADGDAVEFHYTCDYSAGTGGTQ